ncbi:MAG: hypothetical protein ACKO4W_01245, partial [Bacteroidota bacterium]
QQALLDYVKQGGTLIVQYNTNFEFVVDAGSLAPYPIKIARGRATDETCEVRMIAPEHPALNTPNNITAEDFNGWVQERGLYFPSEWDASFTAPLSMNDPGEKPADGSLLVASWGKGQQPDRVVECGTQCTLYQYGRRGNRSVKDRTGNRFYSRGYSEPLSRSAF